MDKKIQVGLAIGLIALLLLVAFPPMDIDATEPMDDSYSAGDDTSSISGNAYVTSRVVDKTGRDIWHSADDKYSVAQSVVDPVSGLEAADFFMGLSYAADGYGLDTSTMKVTAIWEFALYTSTNGFRATSLEWDTATLSTMSGDMESSGIALDLLVPIEVVNTWYDIDEASHSKVYYTETYPQRTAESHPFSLTFHGHYSVVIDDIYGHTYEQDYLQTVVLDLQWVGSGFAIEWSDPQDEDVATTSVSPALNGISDFVAFSSDITAVQWTWSDTDIASYTITLDGAEVASGLLSGSSGVVDWSRKWTTVGRHTILLTVEDVDGNIATDTVIVNVHTGFDEPPAGEPDPPDDLLDPLNPVNGKQLFDRDAGDGDTPLLSLFGGSGNTQVLMLLAIGGGAGWLLYNSKKKR